MGRVLRQVFRGLGTLPYVGSHPGVPVSIFMIALFFASAMGGIGTAHATTAFSLASMASAAMLVLLCFGAYGAAQQSDRMVASNAD